MSETACFTYRRLSDIFLMSVTCNLKFSLKVGADSVEDGFRDCTLFCFLYRNSNTRNTLRSHEGSGRLLLRHY